MAAARSSRPRRRFEKRPADFDLRNFASHASFRALWQARKLPTMKRREFITLLGGAAASLICWPLAGRAQQPGKVPVIGFMGGSSASSQGPWAAAFAKRLRELGWAEGRNVTIEYRWAEGKSERVAEIIAEFLRLKVDVIVTHSNPLVAAAKQATSLIPIVFGAAGDPVRTGLVASLARPGGNVTGLSLQQTDTAGKRLELLREVVPGFRRLAIMVNLDNAGAVLELDDVQTAARALGIEVTLAKIRRAAEIATAFEGLKDHADALYVCNDPFLNANVTSINTLAAAMRLPAIFNFRENVEAGGLMSYGANVPDLFRRAADDVDKILRGAKPGDIPVEQPTKFELVLNLKTAKALGIDIPPALVGRADDVIE
jgi:putative ABC transport system substrate-binding protein